MIPLLVFSLMNSQRVCSSNNDKEYIGPRGEVVPLSIWIDKS